MGKSKAADYPAQIVFIKTGRLLTLHFQGKANQHLNLCVHLLFLSSLD